MTDTTYPSNLQLRSLSRSACPKIPDELAKTSGHLPSDSDCVLHPLHAIIDLSVVRVSSVVGNARIFVTRPAPTHSREIRHGLKAQSSVTVWLRFVQFKYAVEVLFHDGSHRAPLFFTGQSIDHQIPGLLPRTDKRVRGNRYSTFRSVAQPWTSTFSTFETPFLSAMATPSRG